MSGDPLSEFRAASQRFDSLIEGLSSEDWDGKCYHPGGIVKVRTLIGFRLLELVVHGWDIRSRQVPLAHLSEESLPVLFEFISDYLKWFFAPGNRLSRPTRYRFEFSDKAIASHDIVVEGDKAYMEPFGAALADVTFRCSAEAFVLLMCGRITQDSVSADGSLTIEGDDEQASRFSSWFRGA